MNIDLIAKSYKWIYIIFCGILLYRNSKYITSFISPKEDLKRSLIISVFLTLFLGFRPVSIVFYDTDAYATFYRIWYGDPFYFNPFSQNIIFDNLFSFWASAKIDLSLFFVLIDALYFIPLLLAVKKLFPQNITLALLVYLSAFSTFSYGVNGIKAGAAASIFLLAMAYYKQLYVCVPLVLASLGFHHSMILPIGALCISYFFRKTNWYYGVWIASIFISAIGITSFQEIFQSLADEKGAAYLSGEGSYITGFRIDFILYSSVPIILGYWALIKYDYKDDTYGLWLRTYTLTNAIWILCINASYTNRIAYLSWLMYPIVLIYPFINIPSIKRYFKTVSGYHWLFTFIMKFI